jgi:hypothetical protein
MSLTYILIDFENVQPAAEDMSLLRGADFRVRLFHGPNQTRFDAAMVKALQPLGSQLEYIQGERRGKNALDFHIAFYLGRLVEACKVSGLENDKTAAFVIVSKDAGFDALLDPVRALGHRASRTPTIADALAFVKSKDSGATVESVGKEAAPAKPRAAKAATPKTPAAPPVKKAVKSAASTPPKAAKPDPYQRTLTHLQDHPNNRPFKTAALERHLGTFLGKGTTQQAVKKVIDKLQTEGVVVVNGDKIAYNLPDT